LGLETPVLVGWSLGGIICLQYCLDHPTDIKALVLIATQGHKNPRLKLRFILHFLQAQLSLFMDFTQPRKYDRSIRKFPSHNGELLERQVRNMLSPNTSGDVLDWIIADITNNPRQNYFEIIRSVWNWEAGQKLKHIKIPTLILVGDRDSLTPPRISQLLHASIPHSRLVIVEGASHYLTLEHPQRVNTEILKFLNEIGY
jgi:pimeloyl-ACP methyl ester carboxylesterase